MSSQIKCRGEPAAKVLYEKLETCNARVRSRKKTRETCEEEFMDWMEVVEKCVSKDLFKFLK